MGMVALGVWLALAFVVPTQASAQASARTLSGTVVDRQGNVHQVSKLTYSGRQEIEYHVSGQRQLVHLRDIKRLHFMGDRGDEQQTLTVTLRSGRTETGTMFTGASMTPHQDAVGGGGSALRFAGTTPLGPFFILVSDVSEVIMDDTAASADQAETVLKAVVITTEGKRLDVTGLRCRGQRRLTYDQGNRRRFVDLAKVELIDFAEGSASVEQRPVTITYWSGKRVQGTVDASRVRLSGETDRAFFERAHAAWTGRGQVGSFAMGMHAIKQIRFSAPEAEETPEQEPQDTSGR
jgi:hypothetical protein